MNIKDIQQAMPGAKTTHIATGPMMVRVMQVESLRKAQNAIALLIHKGFLVVAEKGTAKGRKATRFRFLLPPQR